MCPRKNVTDSKIQLSNEAEIKHSSEDIKSELEIFGLCTANPETCPVHTQNNNRPKWSFFHKEEDIQALIDGLNERGERESALKHNLILFKSKIDVNIKNCPVFILNPTEDTEHDIVVRKSKRTGGKKGGDGDTNLNFPIGTPIDRILELTLRDMILEVEEKLFVGVLGRLQVPDRNLWRESVIGESSAKLECDKLSWGGKARIAQFKADIGLETGSNSCSSTNTSGDEIALEDATRNSVVRQLATALLQVAQSVDVKYLKPPLAETDKAKKKRTKAENRLRKLVEKRDKEREEQQKLENGANSDDSDSESEMGDSHGISSISDNTLRLPLERWELSLMSSVSFSQVFLHLATLDNSVTWSRSLTKTRCRICRKGGDHDKMLLCDGCDKGHHIYCLKPKLKSIPDGDWFCDICRPKIKAKSPKKNRTIYVEDDDEEEEDDDTEEEELDIEKNGDAEEDFEAAGQEDEEEEDGGFEDDVCDACRIGGTLILCDTCPRSFHRECAALKKIPRGNWSCPECTAPQIDRTRKTKSDDKSSKQSTEEGKSKRVIEGKGTKSQAAGERASNRRSAPSSPETDEDEISFSKRRRAHSRSPSKKTRKGNASDLHFTALQTLLTDVTRHDDAWPFRKAVNKRQVPDYYQVVKKPMDLQTMKEKLVGSEYSTDAEFLADALLIFQNCQQYNMEDTDEYLAGVNLGKYFKKRARKLGLDIDTDHDELPPSKSKKLPGVKKKRQAI
ncbi:hypothetical protein HAZT_HAZT010190 [Hyalella azteca]|uniref:Bromodomain adjacent to zinc finger domain protein 1A n=1 Tax=Hyalella azteca TaxID=294128 RepID=A0A6A0HDQ9_HYAAZ|nr:hypothetical protein HAZT_HAZT010190 [Hyalella azteca]